MRSENIVERLRKIKQYGINTWVNYMLAAPESTLQDDLDTIKVSREAKITYASYTTTVPMEKTELYNYSVRQGLIDPSSYVGDMSGLGEKSSLSCFTEKEKDIRYKILLLGALMAKHPYPLERIALFLIRIIPPNILFMKIYEILLHYYETNKIFKLPKDYQTAPRRWKESRAK